MGDLPHGKRELVAKIKLKCKDRFFSNQRDAEAKLAHLLDLETRLLCIGLTHADLLETSPSASGSAAERTRKSWGVRSMATPHRR